MQQTSADQYRLKAAQLLIKAARATDPRVQTDYEFMAQGYLRLADLAEQNSTDRYAPATGRRQKIAGNKSNQLSMRRKARR